MDEVLVEIICPATSKTYDFWLAKKMTVEQAAIRAAKDIMLYELNERLFDMEKPLFLYLYENRVLLKHTHTVEHSGVRSGCRLILL